MTISEKVSYLKGFAEGLEINDTSKEGKLLLAILDILGDMAVEVNEIQFDLDVFSDELDSVDEELGLLFQEDFSEEENYDEYDEYDGDIYYIFCPNCGEEVLLDEEMLDSGKLHCPECSELLEFDFQELTNTEIDPED